MFATVIKNDDFKRKTKITEQHLGVVGIITVSQKPNTKKLKKILQKYNGEVIFSKFCDYGEIRPFDTTFFKENLLFSEFSRFVLSKIGYNLKIGIYDPDTHHLENPILPRLIAHAEETVICTERNIDNLCDFWLKSTGICPEITENPIHLCDCDVCFSTKGIATSGILFGCGGRGIDQQAVIEKIPEQYRILLNHGVNPAELLCMLENERKYCVT